MSIDAWPLELQQAVLDYVDPPWTGLVIELTELSITANTLLELVERRHAFLKMDKACARPFLQCWSMVSNFLPDVGFTCHVSRENARLRASCWATSSWRTTTMTSADGGE
ncbi:hypothetical protein PRIPAC_77512 [Pristionchus pacificus]|uniref:Uncharacterized protein n=1 Tax=Pristionchus pacificus TaxID=54126 RepID=A0A2A6CJI2_PRIPA|nr:hypothetical protein PRIPAC_77512 [Pristionchus pacificus]|eukprot:PDM78203.1 hypothetical protein PRIPAC_30782 [Pristionchus pacificus]